MAIKSRTTSAGRRLRRRNTEDFARAADFGNGVYCAIHLFLGRTPAQRETNRAVLITAEQPVCFGRAMKPGAGEHAVLTIQPAGKGRHVHGAWHNGDQGSAMRVTR